MTGWTLPTIDDEAAAWAAKLLSGDISEVERQKLNVWLAADARHRQAYAEYADIIAHTDQAWTMIAEKTLERDLGQSASRLIWFPAR